MSKHSLSLALLVLVCAVALLPGSDEFYLHYGGSTPNPTPQPTGPPGCNRSGPITLTGGAGGPGGPGAPGPPGGHGGTGGTGGSGAPAISIQGNSPEYTFRFC